MSGIAATPPEREAAPPAGDRPGSTPPVLPTGTVTFLFSDIEGSTTLWEHDPEAMRRAFSRQEAIVREAMAAHGGYIYKMIGDAFQVAFSTASAALAAALAAQRALRAEPWGPIGRVKVRIVLHTGVTEERGDDYLGPELNRIARLLGASRGGQVLLSQATADLVRDHLPEGTSLCDLGEHILKDLVRPEHIYQLAAPGLPEDFAPLQAVDARLQNLPSPATPFVGREAELAQIEALLRDPKCRLISLVGLGGSGKTRLSIQAAGQSSVFPDGAYFVGLAEVATPEGIVSAIADALRMSFYVQTGSSLSLEAAQTQLLRYLAGKRALLILDNCEHLVGDPLAGLIGDLLAAAPGVKLIATSRERLSLPGEWVLEVAGLSFPGGDDRAGIPQYAAVQLFVQGAMRVGTFTVAASDWPAIARICQLLGGMPLGVEMASAWTKVLSCQEIVAELERDLLSLIATWRTVPARHRTLRTVFDQSWRLLADDERDVCCRLSVFRGGFRREAAVAVAGSSLSLLGALIDKSLLRRGSEGRFEIHPALRQYVAAKLAADLAVRAETLSRHAAYYSEWLGGMNELLKGREQLAALVALRAETQNLHDAWRWLIEQRDLVRLRSVLPAMILFHEMLGRLVNAREIVQLLGDMLRTLGYDPDSDTGRAVGQATAAKPAAGLPDVGLVALALAALRHFGHALGGREQTDVYQRESIELVQKLPDGQEKAFVLLLNSMAPGVLTARQCLDLCEQCIEIFDRLGDVWGLAVTRIVLADVVNFGRLGAKLAYQSYQGALEGFTQLGNDWGRALCFTGLADIERQTGHLEEAYRMGCQSLDTYRQMGDMWRVMATRQTLGEIAEEKGWLTQARGHFEANLAHFSRMGDDRACDYYRERLQRLEQRVDLAALDLTPDLAASDVPIDQGKAVSLAVPRTPQPSVPTDALVEPLSAREVEVLQLLAEGLTNREIAQQLFLSPNTVRVHTFHIYGKLGVNNRTQAVVKAKTLGLLTPP